jgi:ribose transport system substrate-binding protein
MNIRRWIAPIAVALVAAAIAINAASAASSRNHSTYAGKLKIALANSFIGNTWRLEMENTFKAACKMAPFKSEVSCSVYNSGNDVGKQTQQISNLISQHVDAIVIDAASPTGLNGIVKQACARGILVISFDSVVTEKCGLTVNTDQLKFGQLGGQFLATQLHGKGNVVMVTGVAGTSVDTDRNNGVESVIKKYPNMKIVAHYTGNWDSSTAQRATAAQLPSLPQVDGVWVSGGTDGVVKAFIDANKPLPIVAGEGENGYRRYLLPAGYNGHQVTGISIGQPPFLSVASLELAREILEHKHARKSIVLPFPVVTNQTVKSGATVFPNLPDSFFADFTDSGPKATVALCVQAALKGTPCPGTLNVRLP